MKLGGVICFFNSICVFGSSNTFDGYIEYTNDIYCLNIPNLKSGPIYDKLDLPEFNLLLFNQLFSIQRNKSPLFDQLITINRDGLLLKLNEFQQSSKELIHSYIIKPTESLKVKNQSKYYQYLTHDILTDIAFEVDGTYIKAHKIILAEVSDYFHRLFTSPFRESNQSIIILNETSPKAFRALITVIYGGDCSNLKWDLLLEVAILIQRYQITKFNIKDLLKEVKIPSTGFIKLIETINSLYDEITPDLIDLIASKIKTEVDLSSLSIEFIKEILNSSQYQPVNVTVTTKMLNNYLKST